MKILIPDAYFWPERIAFTHLEEDLLGTFVASGNDVTVICPTPTRGLSAEEIKKFRKYKRVKKRKGVRIIRFWAPQEKKNPLIRAIRYLWCNIREYQIGKRLTDTDIIFAVSTPPTQGLVAAKIGKAIARKKGKKIPLVYSLQDVFPDSLINAGLAVKDGLLWRMGRILENRTYQECNSIIVISEGIRRNIVKKGVDNSKIKVVSNWIDFSTTNMVLKENNKLMTELKIPKDKYIVLYAGNFGETQGAEIILDVAEQLREEKDILFVVFGGGSGYNNFRENAKSAGNVLTFDLQPMSRVPEVYSMGDIVLITCKPGTGKASLPSKVWSILACNRRIIASFDLESDLCDVVKETDAGICVEPGNPDAVSEAILAERESADYRDFSIREKAKKIASKDACTKNYLEILQTEVKQTG